MATACCKNDLGSVPHNDGVNIGIAATMAGYYVAILFFAGVRIRRKFYVTLGSDIIIPNPFNEDYLYKCQIEKPDGTMLQSVSLCTDFFFKTYISLDPSCGAIECEEEETFIYE